MRKRKRKKEDVGEIFGETGYGRWGRVFVSLKVYHLMTQIQRRTVLLLDITRLPLSAK